MRWGGIEPRKCFVAALMSVLVVQATSLRAEDAIARAVRQLEAGEPQKALATIEGMLDRTGASVRDDPENLRALGSSLFYRAVAEYELDLLEDARWSWQMATLYYPGLATTDFSSLGPIAEFLAANASRRPDESIDPNAIGAHVPEGVTPPEKIAARAPQYGEGLRRSRAEGTVRVLAVVREDGRLDSPILLEPLAPAGFSYASLEAMRDWRFRPAEVAGAPVDSWYTMTVTFKLR